jgi:hypothetical protein
MTNSAWDFQNNWYILITGMLDHDRMVLLYGTSLHELIDFLSQRYAFGHKTQRIYISNNYFNRFIFTVINLC